MKTVSVERLREVLHYDPLTGILTWNRPDLRRVHGKPAGTVNRKGYLVINLGGISVRAHRAAWAIVHGEYPPEDLDHINRNRIDNRISNLRPASPLESSHNRSVRRDCSSGCKGVTWYKSDKLWCARITVKGKRKFLGLFKRKEDAASAYLEAAKLYQGAFAAA